MSGTDLRQEHLELEQSHNRPHTIAEDCNLTEIGSVQLITPFQPVRSFWTYLKWVFGAIVSGLFRCRAPFFDPPIDDQWPGTFSQRDDHTIETYSDGHLDYENDLSENQSAIQLRPHDIYVELPTGLASSQALSESTCELNNTHPSDILVLKPDHLEDRLTVYSADTLSKQVHQSCILSTELHTTTIFDDIHNGFCGEHKHPVSTAFTLLSSLYADSRNGLIDSVALEHSVDEVVRSVIPRNLSNSSEISVSPTIRKMYAWNASPSTYVDETDTAKQPEKLSLKTDLYASDEPLAYPGKLSMSDGSSSPLSPLTADSCTPTGDGLSHLLANATNDVTLPSLDGQDHTLAWAMSNLRTDKRIPEWAVLSQSSQLPNVQDRKSRDKSPVSTVNSLRIPDSLSAPDFIKTSEYAVSSFQQHDSPPPKPKRSSSLKSQRTPPGTPEPKSVRFADALGLDLETVRHVFDQEVPPKIPASATFDLELDTDESIARLGAKQFGLCFAQPGAASNFIRRVLSQTVCLEDAVVNAPRGILTGTVRVRSLGFEKQVFIRITYNNWATYCDTPASYVQGSHDGVTDRFSFSVVFPDTMVPGDRAQFAIRYEAHTGEHFWDNNHGQNYSVSCYAKATDLAGDGSWVHYL